MVRQVDVESLGIEVAFVDPLEAVPSSRVGWMGEGFQKVGVSPAAAAVLRRAVPLVRGADQVRSVLA